MRVYEAEVGEVRKVAEFMKQFERATQFVKVNVPHTIDRYTKMVTDGYATIFKLEEAGELIGGLGALVFPDLHSGAMTGVETFWFVTPEKRGKGLILLDAFEEWGWSQGCEQLALIHLLDSSPKALERVYRSRGYIPAETHYIKKRPTGEGGLILPKEIQT